MSRRARSWPGEPKGRERVSASASSVTEPRRSRRLSRRRREDAFVGSIALLLSLSSISLSSPPLQTPCKAGTRPQPGRRCSMLFANNVSAMKPTLTLTLGLVFWLVPTAGFGQSGPAPGPAPSSMQYSAQGGPAAAGLSAQGGEPVSYASVTQLNGLLSQLDATSKSTQADLVKLRIEHWKTDNNTKKQALG